MLNGTFLDTLSYSVRQAIVRFFILEEITSVTAERFMGFTIQAPWQSRQRARVSSDIPECEERSRDAARTRGAMSGIDNFRDGNIRPT